MENIYSKYNIKQETQYVYIIFNIIIKKFILTEFIFIINTFSGKNGAQICCFYSSFLNPLSSKLYIISSAFLYLNFVVLYKILPPLVTMLSQATYGVRQICLFYPIVHPPKYIFLYTYPIQISCNYLEFYSISY